MRIFYAVDPPEHIKERILAKTAGISDYLSTGRAIDVFNIHVTVEYIGEVCKEKVKDYIKVLDKAAADARPSAIRLKGISSFFRGGSHLIFLKAWHENGLECVRNGIINELGLPAGPYLPHITLYRNALLKDGYTIKKISDIIGPEEINIPVCGISLMESRTINGKLVYINLYEHKIRGDDHGS
jgi:2'-5' RNA ligase